MMNYIKPEMMIWSFNNMDVITTSNTQSIEWDEGFGDITIEMPD